MPAFFSHARGIAVRIDRGDPQQAVAPFQFSMQGIALGASGRFGRTATIITQVAVGETGKVKYTPTFDGSIYSYIMGDNIGELRVAGVAYMQDCQGGTSGISSVIAAYNRNRIAVRNRAIPISLADAAYWGFLTGMNLEVSDPEHNTAQWALRFNSLQGF